MLAHFRKLLDQLLQTLSDRYALHRDGALSSGVAAEWCWDMDFHCYLLCRICFFLHGYLMSGGQSSMRREDFEGQMCGR